MVAVVSDLVEHQVFLRVHLERPVESPAGFVDDVGDPVGTRHAVGIVLVAEGLRVLLVGKEHLEDGVERRGGILQVVGCIVPSAYYVDVLALQAPVVGPGDESVVDVAGILQVGVPAAALLAQVVQQEVGRTVIDLRADAEAGRFYSPGFEVVGSRGLEVGEIQPYGVVELFPRAEVLLYLEFLDGFSRSGILQDEGFDFDRFFGLYGIQDEHDRDFVRFGQIAQLVDADPSVYVRSAASGQEQHPDQQKGNGK